MKLNKERWFERVDRGVEWGLNLIVLLALALGLAFMAWRLGAAALGWLEFGTWQAEPASEWIDWMAGSNMTDGIASIEWIGIRKVALWLVSLPAWLLFPVVWWAIVFALPWPQMITADQEATEGERR